MKIAWLADRARVLSAEDETVAVILTAQDKANIAGMAPDATIYCGFPDATTPEQVKDIARWLVELKEGK